MKKLGLALVCFSMFLARCDGRENPSAGSNPGSQHLSKNYAPTKQLNLPKQPSQSIYDKSSRLDESDIRQFALTLAAQPMDDENSQSGAREFLVGTWMALAIVADALKVRGHCAGSANSDHQRRNDPNVGNGCVRND